MYREYKCLRISKRVEAVDEPVVVEEPLSLYVNGKLFTTAMLSPQMKEEFVVGHLLTEGIIRTLDEIESLEIQGNVARVVTKTPKVLVRRFVVSGCGGASSFLDETKLPKVEAELKVGRGAIFKGVSSVTSSELHRVTGGVHSCGLFDEEGAAICITQDVGRHNALDKVVGHALLKKHDLSRCFVASTGRISSEMVLKCVFAGVPVIASRGATTSLAIEIARRVKVTVVGFVRGRRMTVYSHEERLIRERR